jgi:hypothetical protein
MAGLRIVRLAFFISADRFGSDRGLHGIRIDYLFNRKPYHTNLRSPDGIPSNRSHNVQYCIQVPPDTRNRVVFQSLIDLVSERGFDSLGQHLVQRVSRSGGDGVRS